MATEMRFFTSKLHIIYMKHILDQAIHAKDQDSSLNIGFGAVFAAFLICYIAALLSVPVAYICLAFPNCTLSIFINLLIIFLIFYTSDIFDNLFYLLWYIPGF